MLAYLITYSLTKAEEHYDSFFDAIYDLSNNHHKQLFDGCMLVLSGFTATAIRKQLLPHLQPLDRLFITKVQYGEIAGQLPDKQKQWIKDNIKKPFDVSDQLK